MHGLMIDYYLGNKCMHNHNSHPTEITMHKIVNVGQSSAKCLLVVGERALYSDMYMQTVMVHVRDWTTYLYNLRVYVGYGAIYISSKGS